MESTKNILELDNNEALKFFLKSNSYSHIDLPIYFDFSELLQNVYIILKETQLSDFHDNNKENRPEHIEHINYKLFSNKDGKYSWRPLQLVHPALYIEFVKTITDKEHWSEIQKKFEEFSNNPNIVCKSIPIINESKRKDEAEQILTWWEEIEQESIKLALDFDYVIHTDITDCYGSIYTHTISWVLHSKEKAKLYKRNSKLLGNKIDEFFRKMNYGQTNGIPQGNKLSDLIAEIILGFIDLQLSKQREINNIKNYKILRYRDAYRIFTKEAKIAEKILKLLSEVLLEFNFKLNENKTFTHSNLIKNSLKKDKIPYMQINKNFLTIQQELLVLYDFSLQHPNSGSLQKWLKNIYNKIKKKKYKYYPKEDKEVLVSIITEIMYRNPKVIPVCSALLSLIIKELSYKKSNEVIDKILQKIYTIPNIGLLEIWLQRLMLPLKKHYEFQDLLCKKVYDSQFNIWNTEWLKAPLKKVIESTDIVNREEIETLDAVIHNEEFDKFYYFST